MRRGCPDGTLRSKKMQEVLAVDFDVFSIGERIPSASKAEAREV